MTNNNENTNQVWYVTHKSLGYFEAVKITRSQVEELETIEQEYRVIHKITKEYSSRRKDFFDSKECEAYALKQLPPEVPVEYAGVIDRIPQGYRVKEVREDTSVHETAYIRAEGVVSLDELVWNEVLAVTLRDHNTEGYFEVVKLNRKDLNIIKSLDQEECGLMERYDALNLRKREILSNPQTFFLDQAVVLVDQDVYLDRIPEGYARVEKKSDEQ